MSGIPVGAWNAVPLVSAQAGAGRALASAPPSASLAEQKLQADLQLRAAQDVVELSEDPLSQDRDADGRLPWGAAPPTPAPPLAEDEPAVAEPGELGGDGGRLDVRV